jgi:hypothetical protein
MFFGHETDVRPGSMSFLSPLDPCLSFLFYRNGFSFVFAMEDPITESSLTAGLSDSDAPQAPLASPTRKRRAPRTDATEHKRPRDGVPSRKKPRPRPTHLALFAPRAVAPVTPTEPPTSLVVSDRVPLDPYMAEVASHKHGDFCFECDRQKTTGDMGFATRERLKRLYDEYGHSGRKSVVKKIKRFYDENYLGRSPENKEWPESMILEHLTEHGAVPEYNQIKQHVMDLESLMYKEKKRMCIRDPVTDQVEIQVTPAFLALGKMRLQYGRYLQSLQRA